MPNLSVQYTNQQGEINKGSQNSILTKQINTGREDIRHSKTKNNMKIKNINWVPIAGNIDCLSQG